MAEDKDGGEKSEQPTPKKLADARRKGQVATTRELPPLFVLLGGVGAISMWAPQVLQEFYGHYRHWLEQAGTFQIDSSTAYALFLNITNQAFVPLIPFGLIVGALALAANLMQTGPLWVEDGLQPKISKLNPKNGIKRIFSWKGVVDLIKSLLKLAMVAGILYGVLSKGMPHLIQFPVLGLFEALTMTWELVEEIVWTVGGALLILAIGDFVYQQWQHNKDLKMTKQEVKDESKDVEGDPQIRSRRLSMQRERSDRKSTRLNSSHTDITRMPSSA